MERRSDYYRIQYAMDDVKPYSVSVDLKEASMDEAMKQLLASTPLRYDINRRFVQVYNPKIQSRQDNMAKLIRGTVVDENGEPLVGVVVRDKASNRGTITDIDGHFRLEVSDREKTTLIASYIGKKTLTYSLKG